MDNQEMQMDRMAKINIRLLSKFKDELYAEYGEDVNSMLKMFDTLYEEQNKIMPLPWYSYISADGGDKNS